MLWAKHGEGDGGTGMNPLFGRRNGGEQHKNAQQNISASTASAGRSQRLATRLSSSAGLGAEAYESGREAGRDELDQVSRKGWLEPRPAEWNSPPEQPNCWLLNCRLANSLIAHLSRSSTLYHTILDDKSFAMSHAAAHHQMTDAHTPATLVLTSSPHLQTETIIPALVLSAAQLNPSLQPQSQPQPFL
ncbi:unnamed protein product [Protopolystoma xenopodis]|uniref:Uncharacterized protein n=1 Tax=Protopolystoma xenopodis TaxID=117903 RepID=A0A3S5FDH4_9PLAT|nr:unnamed protein product [Protopolystoma xenopodis]